MNNDKTAGKKDAKVNKTEVLRVRYTTSEKMTFSKAAELAGISLSKWSRERLRRAAQHEFGLD